MEQIGRLPIFLAMVTLMIVWELLAPKRRLIHSRWSRWIANFCLSILSTLLMRLTIAAAALWAASYATSQQWGLLNLIELPQWLMLLVSIILLDLAIYGQHRASHRWQWLWRFHQIHHTDLDLDVSSAIRFHPIEIAISMCYKVLCIFIIGADPVAVIAFEIILSSCALFNHSNISLPAGIDRYIRLLIVTPDMHRIHHSVIQTERDGNYGFSISLWDRIFSSYTDQPRHGHQQMKIGLAAYRRLGDLSVFKLLLMPFKQQK